MKNLTNKLLIFFDVDYEEDYNVYENMINDVIVKCKIFNDYFELEFLADDLKKIKEIIIL